jgi:phytoene/squalene synthetase
MDVTKHRYRDWDELMHYCRYSAMPVGRFVLELHGESRSTWDASDPLCSALQVINHLQDCKKDYEALDRVYVPLDALERYGLGVEALGAPRATPQLQACLQSVARKTQSLLPQAAQLPHRVKDLRLGIETAVIAAVARKLTEWLLERDPLSERVHLSRAEALRLAAAAVMAELLRRVAGVPIRATHRGGT